jgi:hypothetical protein
MLNNKDFHALEQFILSQCQESQHFALQAYLLVRSMGEAGSEKWKKRCRKILKTVSLSISLFQIYSLENIKVSSFFFSILDGNDNSN